MQSVGGPSDGSIIDFSSPPKGSETVSGSPKMLRMPRGAGQQRPPLRPGTLRNKEGRITLARWYRGDPHAALAARPAPSEEDVPR